MKYVGSPINWNVIMIITLSPMFLRLFVKIVTQPFIIDIDYCSRIALYAVRRGWVMSLTEKIDVLDLLIAVLKEHEKRLDELIRRLENL